MKEPLYKTVEDLIVLCEEGIDSIEESKSAKTALNNLYEIRATLVEGYLVEKAF